jgi:hypothetical protein
MAVFQPNKSMISRHIKNVLEEEELNMDSTVEFFCNSSDRRKKERGARHRMD